MSDKLTKTVRILRRSKVTTDERGHTVWTDPVEEAELELVSTTMLKRVLDSGDLEKRKQLEETASGDDGVLAHDPEKDRFEIIDDADLKEILASEPKGMDAIKAADIVYEPPNNDDDGDEEALSLVSTQALRLMLNPGDSATDDDDVTADSGFDPYNSG